MRFFAIQWDRHTICVEDACSSIDPGFQEREPSHRMLESIMLSWALAFFVLALIAAMFGFGGIAVGAASIAKILFYLFLALFVFSLLGSIMRGRNVTSVPFG